MSSRSARTARRISTSALALGLGIAISVAGAGQANAVTTTVDLGTATSFAVLAGTTVTNTGSSAISGDVGVIPGSAVDGFPPGQMITGNIHINDAPAVNAVADLGKAYGDADGRTPATNPVPFTELSGMTLSGGVYAGGALTNSGTLTLDGEGDANSVWIFQASSSLITSSSSIIALTGNANPCNVFWQVDSSATLGTNSTMVGTIMALTSISATTGASIEGRLLARNGAVTLQNNNITVPADCNGTIAAGGEKTSPVIAPITPPSGVTVPGETAPDRSLAFTGVDAMLPTLGALALIGGGLAILLLARPDRRYTKSE